jgi:hypothetical protein
MKRSYRAVLVPLVAAILIAPGFAVAAPLPSTKIETSAGSVATEVEIAEYSKLRSISPDAARERLGAQDLLARQMGKLRELAGERIVGATLVEDPVLRIEIDVTAGQPIEELDARVSHLGEKGVVSYVDSKSASEIQSMIDDNLSMWLKDHPEISGIHIDERDNRVKVEATGSEPESSAVLDYLRTHGLEDVPADVNMSGGTVGD